MIDVVGTNVFVARVSATLVAVAALVNTPNSSSRTRDDAPARIVANAAEAAAAGVVTET
jgi:hypothetical protein